MKVNEKTIHTHASLDSKNYGYCARRDEPTITRSFTILSPKISTLEDLRTTKLATNKATNQHPRGIHQSNFQFYSL